MNLKTKALNHPADYGKNLYGDHNIPGIDPPSNIIPDLVPGKDAPGGETSGDSGETVQM